MAQGASSIRKHASSSVQQRRVVKTQAVLKKMMAVRPGNRVVAPRRAVAVQTEVLAKALRAEHVQVAESSAAAKVAGPLGKSMLKIVKPSA